MATEDAEQEEFVHTTRARFRDVAKRPSRPYQWRFVLACLLEPQPSWFLIGRIYIDHFLSILETTYLIFESPEDQPEGYQ